MLCQKNLDYQLDVLRINKLIIVNKSNNIIYLSFNLYVNGSILMNENNEIKQYVKDALQEFFSNDNGYLRDVVSDVIEEIAFGKSIEEGDNCDYVDEDTIIKALTREV